jgi:hypothetical protein
MDEKDRRAKAIGGAWAIPLNTSISIVMKRAADDEGKVP